LGYRGSIKRPGELLDGVKIWGRPYRAAPGAEHDHRSTNWNDLSASLVSSQ
jgi:hypothetical protein